jgi:endonuclease/exonuclease/phosphatase family metal-dependent hydrolase
MHWLFLLCLVVGACAGGCASADKSYIPALETFHLSGDAVASADPELTVATFNLHGMDNLEGLKADIQSVPPVQVWLLQEVAFPAPGHDLSDSVAKLRKILPAGEWYGLAVRLNQADKGPHWEGQAIVSRYPLRDGQVWALETSGPKRRRALAAQVDSPMGQISIVDTDHEMSFLDPVYGSRRQVSDLIDRLAADENPLAIVGGDFNSAGNAFRAKTSAANVAEICKRLATVGFAPLPDRSPEASTYRWLFAGVQLDHLFSRGLNCTTWSSPPSVGSDHRCVWGKYVVAPPPSTLTR